MKRTFTFFILVICVFALLGVLGCTAKNETDNLSQNKPQIAPINQSSDVIVLYFSCTGNTKKLAEKIHNVIGGDIEEIVPTRNYSTDDLNYNNESSRVNTEIQSDVRPEINNLSSDLGEYDIILIGYPIWWGTCPPAIKTLLSANDFSGKRIIPFCTSGSSPISESVSLIKELCPDAVVSDGFRGDKDTTDEQIKKWFK